MKTRKWIWLLTAVLFAVMVLPMAAMAEDLWTDSLGNAETWPTSLVLERTDANRWDTNKSGIVEITTAADDPTKAIVTAVGGGEVIISAYDVAENQLEKWTVNVTAHTVSSLEISTQPTKSDGYISGQIFDPTGMIIKVNYTYGDPKTISDGFNCSIQGQSDLTLKAGTNKIDVTYEGAIVSLNINAAEDAIKSVALDEDYFKDKEFYEGDKLSDVPLIVTYESGYEVTVTDATGYTLTPTDALKAGKVTVTVAYTVNGKEWTASKEITVKAKDYTLELDSGSKLKTTTYKSGEKFDATGVTLYIKQGTEIKKTLKDKELSDIFNYTIKDSDVGKTKINVPFEYTLDGQKFTRNFEFSGLTITANKSALDLYEIVNVEMMKTAYPVGYRFTVDDIDFIQYTLTRSGSVKKLYSEDFDKYSEDIDLEVLTLNSRGNVTTKSSTSSYLRTIQEADVRTSSKGSKYVTLRVYVGDEDFDVDVSIGDLGGVSVYYGNTLLTYYEDIMEALDAIDEGDSALTSYSTRTSGTYNIRLGEDQKVTKNYSDYDPERYISIDLNGYNLTFYTTTIGVSSRNKYSVSVTNTSSTTSKFEYYDLDQTLLVDKGETLIFDSDLARDEVPGIYTVKIADTKNGKVTAKPEANKNTNAVTIAHGNDITFTITPDEGYQIDTVKLGTTTVSTTSTSNKDYTVNATTGVATYTMKNVIKDGQTLTATFKVIEKKEEPKTAWTNPFTDISTRATYYDDVRFVNQNGLMNGMTATTFSPSSNMTRAQFVTTLGRMYFSDYKTTEDKDAAVLRIYGTASEFKDVDYDNYNDRDIKYAIPYINWATANGLILGYGDGTFGPRDNITHQQMYIIMYRYATSLAKQTPNVSRVTLSIPDADKIGMTLVGGTWQYWTDAAREGALTAAKYAQQQQFLVSSGAMDPTGDAYRYELATLLHRFSVNVLGWKD